MKPDKDARDKGEERLSIRQNILWNSAGSIINLGCQWLMSIVVVRLSSGYDAAGVFALASSVYGIFSTFGQYRMKTYQVSDVEHENSTGEYLSFRFLTCGVALVLVTVYSMITCAHDAWLAIVLYCVWKTLSLLIEVLHACDQLHFRMDYIGQSLALQGVSSLAVFSILFFATQSLELTFLGMIVCTSLIGLLLDYPRTRRFDTLALGISAEKTRYLIKHCAPIVVAGLAISAAPQLPRQVLAAFEGSSSLGVYASIASPIAIIQMGSSYIYGPLLTTYSELYFNKRGSEFRALLKKTTIAIATVGVACVLAISVMGEPLLVLLYGESIRSYTYLMVPMVLFAVLTGYTWFMSDLLTSIRSFRGTTVGGFVSLAVSLICMFPLIWAFDMNGVTYTGLLSCLGGLAAMGITLQTEMNLKFSETRK